MKCAHPKPPVVLLTREATRSISYWQTGIWKQLYSHYHIYLGHMLLAALHSEYSSWSSMFLNLWIHFNILNPHSLLPFQKRPQKVCKDANCLTHTIFYTIKFFFPPQRQHRWFEQTATLVFNLRWILKGGHEKFWGGIKHSDYQMTKMTPTEKGFYFARSVPLFDAHVWFLRIMMGIFLAH